MSLTRREFTHLLALGSLAGLVPGSLRAAARGDGDGASLYQAAPFGNVRLLHITDTHAQLNPVFYREPSVNLGIGAARGQPPHLVGEALLKHFGMAAGGREAHAFTFLDFDAAAQRYGKVGGFAHLATLIKQLRAEAGEGRSLLLDGGDTWQGSGTSLWTRGQDMVGACNLLGVDIMTGHWEFTYQDTEVIQNLLAFKGEFVAQNISVSDEALFSYQFADFPGFDEGTGLAFKPYTLRELNGTRVAVIGQAFPYTPIANPQRFIPDWRFGIQDLRMQEIVDQVREKEKPDLVVLISHNGMDVDLKMAASVRGIDVIFGGHTHDGVPAPTLVDNAGGKTLVTNAGSNGKFVGVMDLEVGEGKLKGYRYRLLPVFANLLPADAQMQAYIDQVRQPYLAQLAEPLALTETSLYRRGNFNGTFDQVILDALRQAGDAQISLSPGFRWGTSLTPGATITMEDVLNQTAMTYPETYVREMKGSELKTILEDVADNLFNPDPYRQQGGDMVRVGGLDYVCSPDNPAGQRIGEMRLDDGRLVEADKTYKVTGWATVGSQSPGRPVWELVADYLRQRKTVALTKVNATKLVGMEGNPGLA